MWIRGWLYEVEGHLGASVPVILLDTDLAENADEDRRLTDSLYGGSDAYRLKQEAVLGIGGVRMLAALGFQVWQFHMNEGHSALLGLELLHRHAWPAADIRAGEGRYDVQAVRALCNFTTHTPVEAGHDQFDYGLVAHVLGDYIELPVLRRLAGADRLNLTQLAMNLSEVVNGVTERHAEVSRGMFPGYRVLAITNGVHPLTWTCASFRALYNRHLERWCHEPELLVRAELFPDDEVWQAHRAAKQALIDRVRATTGRSLDPERPIIGFARRMTAYKRPDLLFADLDRLRAIARRFPFQVVMAGKAHPRDEGGKHLIESLHRYAQELGDTVPVAFLPGYDMDLALALVSGADVWLNTPQPPLEASGTSGMKAAFNGVPNLSVLDGWWIEGCIEGVTGWAIGNGATGGTPRRFRAPLWKARGQGSSAVPLGSRGMDQGHEGRDRKERVLLQQPPHDAALRDRGVPALNTGDRAARLLRCAERSAGSRPIAIAAGSRAAPRWLALPDGAASPARHPAAACPP